MFSKLSDSFSLFSKIARIGREEDLDVLVKDKDASVRCEVLLKKRVKDLKILLEDEDSYIRQEAEKYLKEKESEIK